MLAAAILLLVVSMTLPAGCSLESAPSHAPLAPTAVGFMGARENDSGSSFFVLDADSGNQTKLAPAFTMGSADVWSPDRTTLAYLEGVASSTSGKSGQSWWLSLIGTDGKNQRKVTNLSALVPMSWSWSADGKSLIMLCPTGGQTEPKSGGGIDDRYYFDIFSLNLNTGEVRRLTDTPSVGKSSPLGSPDGSKIAFSGTDFDPATWKITSYAIYVMKPDGTDAVKVLSSADGIRSFQWSPDGREIVYSSNDDIYVLDVHTGVSVNLTNSPDAADRDPVWSPDGKRIAFDTATAQGGSHICVMDADGRNSTDLFDLSDYPNSSASWSPDSKSILFTDRQTIYSIGADGKNLKVILDGKGTYRDIMYPVWLFK